MGNKYFQFKQFRIDQKLAGMKVTTDGCLFGGLVAQELADQEEPSTILDIGTGTGLLSLMLAQATEKSLVHGIEMNHLAAEETEKNYSGSPWADRLTCFASDGRTYKAKGFYDLIICNPPFFKENLRGKEPNKNLAVHSDELSFDELAEAINKLLANKGACWVMYPEHEMRRFEQSMEIHGFCMHQLVMVRDTPLSKVIRNIAQFKRGSVETSRKELVIKEAGDYTESFKELLRDYYLYLDE